MTKFLILLIVGAAALSADEQEWKERPVAKVVRLLTKMKEDVATEGAADTDAYNKLACWCETNDREKSQAISDAEAKIKDLTAAISGYTAESGQLKTEIEQLTKDIAATEKSLQEATELRAKENEAFTGEEKELLGLIAALEKAVGVIGKNHGEESFVQVKAMVQHINLKYANLLRDDWNSIVDPPLTAFLKNHKNSRVMTGLEQQSGPGYQSYGAQSGQVLGMLKQMQDTFTANLKTSRSTEASQLASFNKLKAAKEAELASQNEQKDDKTEDKANADQNNSQAKEDLAATEESLSANQAFLANVKSECSKADAEYAARMKTRNEENEAIAMTIKILTEDAARDLMSSTLGFVQRSVQKKGTYPWGSQKEAIEDLAKSGKIWRPRDEAVAVLQKQAARTGSPQLMALAVSAKLDAFTKVKKAIDDMVVELKKQQADEVVKRDTCNADIDSNEDASKENNWKREDLESKISGLTASIETLTSEINALQNGISEMHTQLKRAGEDRAAENKSFQETVNDQRATVFILEKALTRLEKFYGKQSMLQGKKASLLQKQAPTTLGAPDDKGALSYDKSGASGGVMAMIQMIINDAKRMEKQAIADEQDAQSTYESFVKDTANSINADNASIVEKEEAKGKALKDNSEAQESLRYTVGELEKLSQMNGALHSDCDYVLKNFAIRQQARAEEIDALGNAKAILSGADFQ